MFKNKKVDYLEYMVNGLNKELVRLREGIICLNDILIEQKETIENLNHEVDDLHSENYVIDALLDDMQSFMKMYENKRFSHTNDYASLRRDLDGMIAEVDRVKKLQKQLNKEQK